MAKVALIVCLLLQGCAAYTVASTGVWVGTGKGLSEHGVSVTTGADCRVLNAVKSQYPCEVPREPGTTYNRSAF